MNYKSLYRYLYIIHIRTHNAQLLYIEKVINNNNNDVNQYDNILYNIINNNNFTCFLNLSSPCCKVSDSYFVLLS